MIIKEYNQLIRQRHINTEYGISQDLVCEKKEIECNNIIKQNCLMLIILQMNI